MDDSVHDVSRLVFAYAERLDAGDFEGVAALFERATYRAGGAELSGSEAVLGVLRGMVQTYDGVPGTKHVVTNLLVEVDQVRNAATARSYFTVLQARPELGLQPIVAGRYHDTFARTRDEWHFTDRLIHTDLVGDVSHHLKTNPF